MVRRNLLLTAAARAVDPEQAGQFVRRVVRLISGGTVLEFIPGPPRTNDGLEAPDLGLASLLVVAAIGLSARLRRRDAVRERSLAWATGLMLLSFYLVAGPAALSPHFERYGMCLVVPMAVLVSLGWSHWLGHGPVSPKAGAKLVRDTRRRARVAVMILSATAWLWLIHFYHDYFLVFQTSGGESHVAFRTAGVEPKRGALEAILAAESQSIPSQSERRIWIVADSWWSYWPLAYFAVGRPEVRVVDQADWPDESASVAASDSVWRVKFLLGDGRNPTDVETVRSGTQIIIPDQSGAPLLAIERVER